jgi:pyruvate-formate lyase-activating enzyme
VKFAEYKNLHYDYFKTIILQMGLFCPLQCKHCSVFAGPRRPERMAPDLATKIIADFAQSPEASVVVLTGGEPFAMMDCLNQSLAEITKHPRLRSYVITSAHWAKSIEEAVSVLRSLPEISLMMVSADIYHEQFVPLEYVRNALHAGHALGCDLVISITVGADSPTYIERMRKLIGPRVWKTIEHDIVQIQPTGRAKIYGIGSFPTTPVALPEGACELVGTPVYVANGNAVVCCQIDVTNEAPRKTDSPYHLGNAHSDSFQTIKERVEGDTIMQALRVWGPRELVRILTEHGYPPRLKQNYDGVCFLCRDLLCDPAAVNLLREKLNEPMIKNQIRLSRMLQYGELRPCPDGIA